MVVLGDGGAHHLDIGLRVKPLDRGEVGERSLLALQRLEGGCGERVVDGAQTIGALRVAVTRVVLEAGGMGKQQRGHAAIWLAQGSVGVSL